MSILKKVFINTGKILLWLLGVIFSYLLVAVILSLLPGKKEVEEAKQERVDIYIVGNGIHTDIVMPASTSYINWRTVFMDSESPIPASLGYVAVGWGNKDFYLHTPTWGDLTPGTAFNAVAGRGEAVFHVAWYSSVREDDGCIKLSLSAGQYERLTRYIQSYLQAEGEQAAPVPAVVWYGKYHRFYNARGRYSLFFTCNTWVNKALKECGQPACAWTPFGQGIFYHLRKNR